MIARQDYAYIIYFIFKRQNILYDRSHIYSINELKRYCEQTNKIPIVFDVVGLPTNSFYNKNFTHWYE
jgi:hypothetical protein